MVDDIETLQALLDCDTPDALRRETSRQLGNLGFDHWMYASAVRAHGAADLVGDYPQDWLAYYHRQGYFELDPVIQHCRMRTTPCLWSSGPASRSIGRATPFFREAARFGLRFGVGLPIHGPGGQWNMVSVASGTLPERPLALREFAHLHLLSAFVHEAGQRFMAAATAEPVHLTQRELDSLRWAAEGKTSWEIGQLIGIADRTVVFHLNNAAKKLGVIGRRQAVAKAISLQLIAL